LSSGVVDTLSKRIIHRMLAHEPRSMESIVMPYSFNQEHWHELFVCFPERIVYHFEGLGKTITSRDTIPAAVKTKLGNDWTTLSVRGHFQVDAYACGVWLCVVTWSNHNHQPPTASHH
jgi:hypothetical protein